MSRNKYVPMNIRVLVAIDPRGYNEIAKTFNIARATVYKIKKEFRTFKRKESVISDIDTQKIIIDTRSQRTIAKDYNVSRAVIARIKQKHNHNKKITEMEQKIRQLEHTSLSFIKKLFGNFFKYFR